MATKFPSAEGKICLIILKFRVLQTSNSLNLKDIRYPILFRLGRKFVDLPNIFGIIKTNTNPNGMIVPISGKELAKLFKNYGYEEVKGEEKVLI